MPKRSKKHGKKSRKTRKQKMYIMKGCAEKSRKNKSRKVFSSLGKSDCPKCGPGCMCGPSCNCPSKCGGSCYLNRPLKGGAGCGPYGCPIAPFSWARMNAKQGGSKQSDRKQCGGLRYPPPNNVMPTGHVLPYGTNALGSIGQIGSGQVGGTCGSTCGLPPMQAGVGQAGVGQAGGAFYKPGPPMPGPIVGNAWGASFNKWPGIDGISGNRNFLKSYDTIKNNIVTKDPQQQQLTADIDAGYKTLASMIGGYKYKTREKKGGGLIPQDLVNLGQDFTYNLKSAYNTLNGYNAPVNPLPYKDQLPQSLNSARMIL